MVLSNYINNHYFTKLAIPRIIITNGPSRKNVMTNHALNEIFDLNMSFERSLSFH